MVPQRHTRWIGTAGAPVRSADSVVVADPRDVVLADPPPVGSGRHKAIDAGMRVARFTLESLTAVIGRAAVDSTTAKAIAKITRCALIATGHGRSRRVVRSRGPRRPRLVAGSRHAVLFICERFGFLGP
jgi:hypothetical protein